MRNVIGNYSSKEQELIKLDELIDKVLMRIKLLRTASLSAGADELLKKLRHLQADRLELVAVIKSEKRGIYRVG